MQLAILLLAALSATASATPRPNPTSSASHPPMPTQTHQEGSIVGATNLRGGYKHIISLMRDADMKNCGIIIAGPCQGSFKIGKYNSEDNTCHGTDDETEKGAVKFEVKFDKKAELAKLGDTLGAAEVIDKVCDGYTAWLAFSDTTVEGKSLSKGTFLFKQDNTDDSSFSPIEENLGLQAQCAVGKKGDDPSVHQCDS